MLRRLAGRPDAGLRRTGRQQGRGRHGPDHAEHRGPGRRRSGRRRSGRRRSGRRRSGRRRSDRRRQVRHGRDPRRRQRRHGDPAQLRQHRRVPGDQRRLRVLRRAGAEQRQPAAVRDRGRQPEREPATVSIEDMRGPGNSLRLITSFEVQPTQSVLTAINGTGGLLPGSHMVSAPGLHEFAAFRVTSDVPITAMQLFPVGGGPSHVSEASMLLPVNALDTSYLAANWQNFSGNQGFAIVVAIEDATTVFTDGGDYMLDAFDAWHFAAGADGTGYYVGADKPVAVFSGIACTMIPALPWYACDHLEEQMLPLSAWGSHYVGARHPHRVPNLNPQPEEVFWRIIAAVDNTTVTLNPPVAGAQIQLTQAGDWVQFGTAESFEATGDHPFLLVQYMSGCYNVIAQTQSPQSCNQGPTGDPYMMQSVPVEQWLTQLPFLTDTSYPRDFVTIIREQGTTVTLDCLGVVSDDHFTPIPNSIYEVGQVDLDIAGNGGEGNCVDGAQFLTADKPVGVLVGGVDWATSYGYPGGLSLDALWEPPDPQG